MKQSAQISKEIAFRTNEYSDNPNEVFITFTHAWVKQIHEVMQLVKTQKITSAKITCPRYEYDNNDWRDDGAELIIFGGTIYFYAQSKYDSADQIESQEITLDEICQALEMPVPKPTLNKLLFINTEDGGITFFNEPFETFINELKEEEYAFQLYQFTGNHNELLQIASTWDEYAYITEQQYNQLKELE